MESGKRKRVGDKVGFHEKAKESFLSKFLDGENRREGFVEGNRQERTDTVADFNLEEAIRSLEQMQSKILRELSDDAGL